VGVGSPAEICGSKLTKHLAWLGNGERERKWAECRFPKLRGDPMTAMAMTVSNRGEVLRVATNTLAYLVLDDQKTILSFTPSDVKDSNHKDFAELNIKEGLVFDVRWHPAAAQIDSAEYVAGRDDTRADQFRTDEVSANLRAPEIPQKEESAQIVLHPNLAEKGRTVVRRAINPKVRKFGKILDTSQLRPGDLMLSEDLQADAISRLIAGLQTQGGTPLPMLGGRMRQCILATAKTS
jgi:hypothetical protein